MHSTQSTYNKHFSDQLLKEKENELKDIPRFTYPYSTSSVLEYLERSGQETLPLFAYGSLMNKASAARTLSPKTLQSYDPAIAFKVKRLFNRDIPVERLPHWGVPEEGVKRGMLNVVASTSSSDTVNGVFFAVQKEDIPKLIEREFGYNLVPILISSWSDYQAETPNLQIAFVLEATEGPYISSDIKPRPGYFQAVYTAAESVSELFAKMWVDTTYSGDGTTSVSTLLDDKEYELHPPS